MSGNILKLTLACLLFLGAPSFLKAQAKAGPLEKLKHQPSLSSKDDTAKYNPSPKQLDSDLAWMGKEMDSLHAEAAKMEISPESLVVFLSKDVTARIAREKDPKEKALFEKNYSRGWEEFLKWLGAYPSDSDLKEALPVFRLNDKLIASANVDSGPLKKVHPEFKKGNVKQAFDAFYADYRKVVLKNRRWPAPTSSGCCGFGSPNDPVKDKLFKVTQMGVFIGLAQWTINLLKAAKRDAAHLDLVRTAMADLHKQRTDEGIELAPFVAFLDSYLDRLEPERAAKFWSDPLARTHVWLPFLKNLEIISKVDDIPAKKVKSFFAVKSIWVEVKSDILDKTALEPVGPFDDTYDIAKLFDSFFRGYERIAVTLTVPVRQKINRMAEFITLGRWAIETWKAERTEAEKKKAAAEAKKLKKAQAKADKLKKDQAGNQKDSDLLKNPGNKNDPINGPDPAGKRKFPIKKSLKILGGLVGIGLAARYGIPAAWNAIFGPEVLESPNDDEAVASPASKPDVGEEVKPEDYKQEDDKGGEGDTKKIPGWLLYLLGGVGAVVIINFVVVAGCCLCRSAGNTVSEARLTNVYNLEDPSASQNQDQDGSNAASITSAEGAYSSTGHIYSQSVDIQPVENPESRIE